MPRTKHTAQQKRQIKQIIQTTQTYMDRQNYFARGNVFLDKVILAFVSKSLMVIRSVVCLVEAGFPEEAFGLTRTLVEIALNLRYITNRSPEQRAKRFVRFYAKIKMEYIRRTLKHYSRWKKSELRKMMQDYKKVATLARNYPDKYSWARTRKRYTGSVATMAERLDTHEKT